MNAHSMIMTFRPMSQMLRIFVVPEIERRVTEGTIAADQLPFYVRQFRLLQGNGQNIVEINDDVRIVATVPVKRAVAAGEPLNLADVSADECFLEPPVINGSPASFFLCRSVFLNFVTMFDFTPNAPPSPDGQDDHRRPMRYPLRDMAHAEQLAKVMKPTEKFQQLAGAGWPPGPGYYPGVLWRLHEAPDLLQKGEFADLVSATYSEPYWRQQLEFWTETKLFGDRIGYVNKVVDEYCSGDYVSSIYILVPHFEGIVKDYLSGAGSLNRYRFESCVADLKKLVLSRKALMFPRQVLDQIFEFIERGTFLAETGNVNDPARQVTRHGIAHGVFTNFENRDIALKYLILLDALAFILLHDKLLAGTL